MADAAPASIRVMKEEALVHWPAAFMHFLHDGYDQRARFENKFNNEEFF